MTTNFGGFTGCSGAVAFYVFDFSSTTNNAITINSISTANSDNQCCGLANNFGCSIFEVITDPNAAQLSLSVSGPCGNVNLYYTNCNANYTCGDPICLTQNQTVHRFLMCRTGGPTYNFTFTQTLAPTAPPDIITAVGCTQTLTATGLNNPVWTSVGPAMPPTANGTFNNLLSCTNCLSTVFTPNSSTPTTVQYQITGQVISPCAAAVNFIDTVTVTTYPTLFANPGPNMAICNGSTSGTSISASAVGGTAPYTYTWTGPSGFSDVNTHNSTTDNTAVMNPGVYTVVITDATGCPSATTTVTVTSFNTDIIASAGNDITVCRSPLPTVNINATVAATGTGIWSGGSGTFNSSTTDLTLAYTPSAAELAAGSVTLTLTPTNTGGCPATADNIIINLPQFTSTLTAVPTNVTCNGFANGQVNLTITPGAATATTVWSNAATTEDILGLIPGSYTVTVTDANGCTGQTSAVISQPNVLTAAGVGTNVTCNGGTNGSVNLTVSGGTPAPGGYTYAWTTTNGSIPVGQATLEDPAGLTAGTYSVTVSDQNGCSASTSVILTQPTAVIASNIPTNVTCNGGSNGSAIITASGGAPGYNITWNGTTSGNPAGIEITSSGGTFNMTALIAGTYNVTVTDAVGCPATTTVNITQPLVLDIATQAFTNETCYYSNDGAIIVNASGGTAPYTYSIISPSVIAPATIGANGSATFINLPSGNYTIQVTDNAGCTDIVTQIITQPTELVATSNALQQVFCNGGSNGSFLVNAVGGGGTYEYTIISPITVGPQDPATFSGLSAATYTIVISDQNGCTDTITQLITQPLQVLSAVLTSQTNILCNGGATGAISVTASGGTPNYTYSWIGPNGFTSSTEDPTGLVAGDYTLTVTDANGTAGGCLATLPVTLTQPLAPLSVVLTSQTNILCNGGATGAISVTASGGTPNYTYSWIGPGGFTSTSEDITGLIAGDYTLTVTDANGTTGGCLATLPVTLTQPTAVFTVTLASQTDILCNGGATGAINVTVSGGVPAYNFSWTGAGGFTSSTEDLTGLVAGVYNLTVQDQNSVAGNCPALLQVTLIQPLAPLSVALTSQTNILCNGGATGAISVTASGGTPNYTYSWIGPNGFTSSTEDPTGLVAGDYTLTVTDANGTTGGCLATLPVTLTQPITSLSSSITASIFPSGSNIQCFGGSNGSINLSPSGGTPGAGATYTYVWSTVGGTIPAGQNGVQDPSGLTAGTYNVTISDANNCTTTTTITLVQPTDLVASSTSFTYPSGSNISCFGFSNGSINLIPSGGSPGYTYFWTPGGGGSTIPVGQATLEDPSGLTAGTYNLLITDLNGCTENLSVTLIQPPALTISSTVDNVNCFNGNDGAINVTVGAGSPGYTFVWNTIGGSGLIVGVEDQSTLTDGSYTVTATDLNGCQISSTSIITEPTALSATVDVSVYSNGFNVTGCNNDGEINVNVSGGTPPYSYIWTGVPASVLIPNSPNQTNLGPGLYTITVVDDNGCSVFIDTLLLQAPIYTVSTQVTTDYNGEDISCFGSSNGGVTAIVTGGVPAYTFDWNSLTNPLLVIPSVQSPTGLPAGTYQVTVEDQDGCLASSTVTITSPDPFIYNPVVSSNYNGQDISCFNASDGSINLTFSGGTPGYTFQWTNANNAIVSSIEDPVNLPDGTYTVLVTDINGCSFDTLISLVEPNQLTGPAIVTSDYNGADVSCFGEEDGSVQATITGGTPVYDYTWFDASTGGVLGSGQTLTAIGAGTYTVMIEDANGCDYTTNVTVTEPNDVTSSITVLTNYFGNAVSCVGEEDGALQASANGGTPAYAFSWNTSPVQTTQVATNLGVGTITLTVTDLNGCQSTSFVNLSANPVPTVSLPAAQNICVDELTEIEAPVEPGGTANWEFSDGQTFNGFGPFNIGFQGQGCYDLEYVVTNQYNCSTTVNVDDYICVNPNPLASFTANPNSISNIDNVVTFNNLSQGATDYIWYFGDGSPYSTQENPIHEYGFIEDDFNELFFPVLLIAISEYGCLDSTLNYINYNPALIYFVPNTFTPDGDDFNNVFKPVISTGFSIDKYQFLIFNRWGELIFETQDIGEGWDGTYKGKMCQDGTYTWKLIIMQSFDAEKIVDVGHVNLLRGGGDF